MLLGNQELGLRYNTTLQSRSNKDHELGRLAQWLRSYPIDIERSVMLLQLLLWQNRCNRWERSTEVAELFECVADQCDGVAAKPFLALVVDAFGDADDHRDEYGDNRHHCKHLDEREAGFISARSHKQINRPNAGV